MDMIASLLAQREQEGLRQLFIAAIVLTSVTLLLNVFFLPDTPVRGLRLAGATIPIGGSLVAFWLLRSERRNFIAGVVFTVLATTYLIFSAYVNTFALDPELYSFGMLTRMVDKAGIMLVVAATALTLRPVYPIMTALTVVSVYGTLLIVAGLDPRTHFAIDYNDYLRTPSVLPTVEASVVVFPLLIGAIVAYSVRKARNVTRQAVQLEIQNRDLSRYFSPNVVAKIASGGIDATRRGGTRQDVVVLFSDMEGFTGLSAAMQPEEALALLSDYQERMVGAIFAHQGTLDKFIGDGIMATFGTPDPDPDAAAHAVRAARAMEVELRRLNIERSADGLQPIKHRIGIHAGPALVGNVGTARRLEYTVIGDSVNVASRVEQACKEFGESFLISNEVRERLADEFQWRSAGETAIAGHPEGLKLFAPS